MISMIHAIAAQAAGVPIIAVASRTAESAKARAEQIGCPSLSYDALPNGADIVVVATPPVAHASQTIAALAAGATVLVEKPLARTLAEADAIVAAAATASGGVVYAENQAFAPVVQEALRLIAGLGPLEYLDIRALSPRPSWGDFLNPAWGGGCLFDLGAHPVALALLAAGDDAPRAVAARLQSSPDTEVDDHAVVDLEFASGLRAHIEVSWREASTTWDLQASSATGVVRCELLPTIGLEHNGEPIGLHSVPENVDSFVHDLGYVAQFKECRRIASRTADQVADTHGAQMNAEFGRRVLEIICAAYTSASRSGDAENLPFTGSRARTPAELWS
jgi:predicted dehydrogenase